MVVVSGQGRFHDPSGQDELAFGEGIIYPARPDQTVEVWREQLRRWRAEERERVAHDGRAYELPEFAWTQSAFSCAVLMLWDETFYDRATGTFRVEEYVRRGVDEFGGYDAVVLWHAYPLIGIDGRNQYDFYRLFPGGLAGLRDVVARFQALGVRVFVDYNPWDIGTRREGVGDDEALASLLTATGADGLFLDTMKEGSSLRAAIAARRSGVGLEAELCLPTEHVRDHHLSWAQFFDIGGEQPVVLRNKWFEQRHMLHLTSRWSENHVDELHTAFINGVGVMVWENVFGTYRPWSEFDKLLLRAIAQIQRACAATFATGVWTPSLPTRVEGVYASSFESAELKVWTFVNRRDRLAEGPFIELGTSGRTMVADLVSRRLLPFTDQHPAQPTPTLAPYGVGAVAVAKDGIWPAEIVALLAGSAAHSVAVLSRAARVAARPEPERTPLPKAFVPSGRIPSGMVAFPAAEAGLRAVFRQRECGTYEPPRIAGARFETMHRPIEHARSMGRTPSPSMCSRSRSWILRGSSRRPDIDRPTQ